MNRNRTIIGTLAVLMLVSLAAVPVSAAVWGNVIWNATSAQYNSNQTYTWGNVTPVEQPVAYFIAIRNPAGTYVQNTTHLANGGTGVGSYILNSQGTWTVYLGNSTNATVYSDTINVPGIYWPAVTDVLEGLGVSFIPALLGLIVAYMPLLILLAVVPFIFGFMKVLLDKINF
jgi:hypothetical protein